MLRVALFGTILLLCFAAEPPNLSAQNTPIPNAVRDVIGKVELGVQVDGGVQFRRRNLHPLQERSLNYLTRPVSSKLSHTVPYYGVGVGLRGYEAKLTFAFQFGDGVQTTHWIPFENGSEAIPYEPNYREWVLRAQYFVIDWIGVGLSYRNRRDNLDQSFETPIKGKRVFSGLFNVRSRRTLTSVYVPIQREWDQLRLFGRIGGSVFGRANEFYNTGFVRYQSPDQPGLVTNQDSDEPNRFDGNDQSLNVQFARVGVEALVWQTSVRSSFGVERLAVPDWSTTWSYDVQMEIGLPF